MRKALILIIAIIFSATINGQTKDEIHSILEEYSKNYGKPNYGQEFVNTKLNPAILKVEELVCEENDIEFMSGFLEMLLKTKGVNNEVAINSLGGIFICNSEIIYKYYEQIYPDKYLREILKVGFENKTADRIDEIDNYIFLRKRLNHLVKTK